jgi:lipopolysaccharide export system protein LptA
MADSSRVRWWLVLLLLPGPASPDHACAQEGRVIVLENADSLVGKVINGQRARELIGNVRFSQENIRVSCDRALQFLDLGNAELSGNVVVQDSTMTLRSPRGMFFRDERKAVAYDSVRLDDGTVNLTARYGEYFVNPKVARFRHRVVVRDSASTIIADSLTYFRADQHSVARGRVAVFSPQDNVTITGGRLDAFTRTNYSRMTENPVLVKFDSSSGGRIDTLVVRSLVMESYRDSVRRLIATDSVEIVRSNLAATGGLAVFYTEADSILLRRAPVVWYQQTQVTGDSINVSLRNRKLDRVHVLGNTVAVSRTDSLYPLRFDQLAGERMRLQFAGDGIEEIRVDNRALSVYHLYDDSVANGLNKTSGDRIIMTWREGKLHTIRVYDGIEGQYVPENLVRGREDEYALPGFQWRERRPQVRRSDFTTAHDIVKK